MNRGLTVPSALQSILNRQLSEKELFEADVLGWSVELLQAFFPVSDDIMDGSITRRGQLCWYKQVQLLEISFLIMFSRKVLA